MAGAHLRLYLHPVAISAQAVSAEKMLHPVLLLMPLPVRTYSGGRGIWGRSPVGAGNQGGRRVVRGVQVVVKSWFLLSLASAKATKFSFSHPCPTEPSGGCAIVPRGARLWLEGDVGG